MRSIMSATRIGDLQSEGLIPPFDNASREFTELSPLAVGRNIFSTACGGASLQSLKRDWMRSNLPPIGDRF